jgi:biofilm PGA synthesis N-glycosyltransferase PgaC
MAHIQIAILIPIVVRIILFVVAIVYLLLFTGIIYGWKKIPETDPESTYEQPTVSVIIAVRNEEDNLPLLLDDLSIQDYPSNLTEIYIVDDHSDRPLPAIISHPLINLPNVHILMLPDNQYGKKNALAYAANKSNSELLLFTDGDCRVSKGWIGSFARYYAQNRPGIIIGLVGYTNCRGLIQNFFHLEFLALVVSGAGMASIGHSTMCNGANLAVDRQLYLQLIPELHADILTGDDIFLLHAAKRSRKYPIVVLRSKISVVRTLPSSSFSEFIQQRARWISKGPAYTDRATLIMAIIIFIENITLLCSFGDFLFSGRLLIFLGIFSLKTIADCLVIGVGLEYLGGLRKLLLVPLFEMIYPLYMIGVSLQGLKHFYTWKKRSCFSVPPA